jgi:CO/xanthine dehydrogenase FAD-binding subunit
MMNSSYRAATLEDALQNLNRDMTPFAGGTDLMVRRMGRDGIADVRPVFIGHLEELRTVRAEKRTLTIGAACTMTQLLENQHIPASFKEAIAEIAAPAVRNRATIGGNICNASPAADTLPWLYAVDAAVTLQSVAGTRTLALAEFITGPGSHRCRPDELLTAVTIPNCSFSGTFHHKVAARRANALSKLSFIGLFQQSAGVLGDIRIAFGAVGPTVLRDRSLELSCCEKTSAELAALIPELTKQYAKRINPINDQRSTRKYRQTTALNLLRHFLTEAAEKLSNTPDPVSPLTTED